MRHALINGLLFSLSLIFAIGAQNIMVLRQGLLMQHIFIVCLLCAVSDAILIQTGIFAMAGIADYLPAVANIMRFFIHLWVFTLASCLYRQQRLST